jgi:hypothetical protein
VGCGDGQATKGSPLGHHIGLELSEEATARPARRRVPRGNITSYFVLAAKEPPA